MNSIYKWHMAQHKLTSTTILGALLMAASVGWVTGSLILHTFLCFALAGCKPGPVIWK
jgi:hypothetical protein